ncbi:hypothetical protein PIB30_009489 [Stylosanthes scabra]|uniref:TIR domain-containing protein n=1 Tax=Stylosanthes scabra TaxID=79078 RepID=A0ABU6Y1U2_9FABA|nr:hypothetical protein [Stylosanthes scabra]
MLGTSSSSSSATKHDVFISFRGEDTRDGFTSHLCTALRKRNIHTYMDDKLVRGEQISSALEIAIQESTIYVIVLSQGYASSRWCLDELTSIMDCKHKFGREVIPVFFKVDPSHVRHQIESYGQAFQKHQHRYKDKVQPWKSALTQAANLSGWDSRVFRPESVLVEEIVEDISRKLDSQPINDYEGLVGIDKHVEQIESILHLDSADVRIIGIWGMRGIGKTTIALALYRKLATQFSNRSFFEDVSEKTEEYKGGKRDRSRRFQGMKVLLIVDNLNSADQLKDLIGRHRSFGQGSRIIITSSDKQVLNNVTDEIYEVKKMDFQDSLQLFSLHAFKQNYPIESYMEVSVKVLKYAEGIPLALKVLGYFLCGRTREAWESELQKLEKIPNPEIFNVLKLSFDALDEEQQDIFLDIVSFYRGHDEHFVKQTLNECGFSATIGIEVLKERCLISILNRKIVMHDLIQDMGQEIIRLQGVNNPGKRSRLLKHQDIYQVLKNNKGTDAIQCIMLDMCKIRNVSLHAETFKMMHQLRMLQFFTSKSARYSNVDIPEPLISLPDELRFLRWDGFPQISLPQDFCPENLVELSMRDSHLERLWDGQQDLPNLKRLDLSGSRRLIEIPDLSQSPNIEEIILSRCVKLGVVYSSSFLAKLSCLWLNGCDELRTLNLPSSILLKSLGVIVLYNCHSLENFSVSKASERVLSFGCSRHGRLRRKKEDMKKEEDMKKKEGESGKRLGDYYYCLGHSFPHAGGETFHPIVSAEEYEEPGDNIHSLRFEVLRGGSPSSFPSLKELCWLDLSNCEFLTILPVDLFQMKFLKRIDLHGCSSLESLPEINQTMENLTVLILDKTAIQELPSSLQHFVGLEELSLHGCQRLEFIPSSIGSLSRLRKLDVTYCESLETIPSSIFKLKLSKLDLHGCSKLTGLPEILEAAKSIALLRLTKAAVQELPSSLDNLVGLTTLCLSLCSDLELLPDTIVNLNLLSDLDCSGCARLTKVPYNIGRLSSLRELSLQGSGIVSIPESIAHLSSLKSLDLSDCQMLECIPVLPPFLKQLLAFDCPSIRRVSSWRPKLPPDSKEGVFKFHFTNSQELDPSGHSNIADDAWHTIIQDAYRCVLFCFPGNGVPHWFPYRSRGNSVTMDPTCLKPINGDRLIGFALCVVFLPSSQVQIAQQMHFPYRLKFEYDDGLHVLGNDDDLRNYFYWNGTRRILEVQDHTLVWKYTLESSAITYMLSHARNFNFEICDGSHSNVAECGICPLYSKETQNNFPDGDYWVHYKHKGRAANHDSW